MQYIPANEDHEECVVAASRLGQVLNINPRLLGRAFEAMGIMRTLWALHLVRQRLADGQIQLGAGPYFNGMVAKARKGELDIDRSIWGLRANIA